MAVELVQLALPAISAMGARAATQERVALGCSRPSLELTTSMFLAHMLPGLSILVQQAALSTILFNHLKALPEAVVAVLGAPVPLPTVGSEVRAAGVLRSTLLLPTAPGGSRVGKESIQARLACTPLVPQVSLVDMHPFPPSPHPHFFLARI